MTTPSAMFSQVTFTSIPQSYRSSAPIICSYTHCSTSFQPSPRDWVGLFKVGWSSTKNYHTFVWAEPSQDASVQSVIRQAVFKEYYLPKDDGEFYQFCYVDASGQVRGLSSAFCFSAAEDQSFQIIPEDDMMVVSTQTECKELQAELDHLREENQMLENSRQKLEQEISDMKEENEKRTSDALTQMERLHNSSLQETLQENQRLKEEKEDALTQVERLNSSLQEKLQENQRLKEEKEDALTQVKGLNSSLQEKLQENQRLKEEKEDALTQVKGLNSSLQEKLQENQRLKEEMKSQTQKELQSQSLNSDKNDDRYSRSLIKINQLKEERSQLKEALSSHNEEITKLRARSRDAERELSRARDDLQLLEVDLQTSDKEKERLAAEVHRLQENQENQQRLRNHENRENREPTPPQDQSKAKCEALVMKLKEAEGKVAYEKEQSKSLRKRVELLDKEIRDITEEKNKVLQSSMQEKCKSSKLELQLSEIHQIMAEKDVTMDDNEHQVMLVCQEKEELERENQTLRAELESLRTVYSDLRADSDRGANSSSLQPNVSPTRDGRVHAVLVEASGTDEIEHLYESIDHNSDALEEKDLVCRFCAEIFPSITTDELDAHEQSHCVCPFCCLLCDDMDQGAYEDHVYSH